MLGQNIVKSSTGTVKGDKMAESSQIMQYNCLPSSVLSRMQADGDGLNVLLGHLLGAFRDIGTHIRNATFSTAKVGTENSFGDNQLEVDVKCDDVIFAALRASGTVNIASSEETPEELDCGSMLSGEGGFSVAFDPLDGSSIIDANFAVGSIVGIWPGKGLVGRRGSEQCCSMIAIFGPRVSVALAFNDFATSAGQRFSLELTMHQDGWVVTTPNFTVAPVAKTFAFGNLRATADNSRYMSLLQYFIRNQYTLRYSGGLVPDIYHILVKGQGIFTNAPSPTAKAKLRLAFEAAPIALLVEAAGGATCIYTCEVDDFIEPVSILDAVITDINRRVGVAYGSAMEVARFKAFLFSA